MRLAPLLFLVLASCSTVPIPGPELVRTRVERPMSGRTATLPLADALSRITNRTSPTHMGTDFTARRQALPVFAVKEGVVASNSSAASSSGAATITVYNSDGSVSRYLHVGSAFHSGDPLTLGEFLGLILLPGQPGFGSTNTGAHLHYEQYLSQSLFDRRVFMTTAEVLDQWKEED